MPRLTKKASKKAKREMMRSELHKYKHGELHSGSRHGPVVKNRKQAIAIALHQSGQSKYGKKGKGRKRRGAKR
jgi:hypothetical protein